MSGQAWPVVKVAQYLLFTTLLVLIILVNIAPLVNGGTPSLAVVKGISMLPTLREGDIVFITRPPPEAIKPGDVIIYDAGGKLIIHRVIDVRIKGEEYYYVTKGDNNPGPDIFYFDNGIGVPYDRVIGRVLAVNGYVVKIPYLGYLSLLIRRN